MGRLTGIILLLLLPAFLMAQDTAFIVKPEKVIAGTFTNFATDNLGNVYLVTTNNQVKKLNSKGDSVAVFNDNRRYGKIHSIDVSNAHKILLFYRQFSTIVVLDRFLSVINTIDLRQHNMTEVSAVALSYDNNTWLYDLVTNKIRKIDDNGKLLMESADLRMVFNEVPAPSSMIDDNQRLHLYDETKGWYIFDYYGAYQGRNDFRGWKDVQAIDGVMTGRDGICVLAAKPTDILFTKKLCTVVIDGLVKLQHRGKQSYVLFPHQLVIYRSFIY